MILRLKQRLYVWNVFEVFQKRFGYKIWSEVIAQAMGMDITWTDKFGVV